MTNPQESSPAAVESLDTDAPAAEVSDAPEVVAEEAEHSSEETESSETLVDTGNSADGDADEDDEDDDDVEESGPSKTEQMELESEIAADYLEELMDIADLDGDIDTYLEGGRPCVSIQGGSEKLVGKDGKVLDALQELARLAVMTETGHRSRLMLDVSGYRDKRRRELEAIGHDAVAEVKETGASVRLTPMNAFERKIVHDIVAAAGLVSESEGQEPQRRVVVQPK